MKICSRLTCNEQFETRMDLVKHEAKVHYKNKCEICKKQLKSKRGLKIHFTKKHVNGNPNLDLKNASIRQTLEFSRNFQNVFENYHANLKRRSSFQNNMNFVNFFRVRPTTICFKEFKNKAGNFKVIIDQELTYLISPEDDDINGFWKRILTYFKKELSQFSDQRHFDVSEFDLEDEQVEEYNEKVESYRQCISACFNTIRDIFVVDKDNNLDKSILGKLTLRKLQIEILSDISLATKYIYKDAPKIVEMCKQVYQNDNISYQDKFSNLCDLKEYVNMINSTVQTIKTDNIIEDYEKIIETLKEDMKNHKIVVDDHMGLLQAESLIAIRHSQVPTITLDDDSQDDDEHYTEDEDEYDTENESENGEVDANDDEQITVNADNNHHDEDDTNIDDIDQLLSDHQDITDSDEASVNNSPQSSTQSEHESSAEVITVSDDDDDCPANDVTDNLIDHKKIVGSRIDVSKLNLYRLINRHFLCDATIQAYLQLLSKLNNKYLVYDTNFYQAFKQKGYKGVEKHYRNEQVMSREKILIPVCENKHWFLIVIDLKSLQVLCIDPLYSQTKQRLEDIRDNYLFHLYTSYGMAFPSFSLEVCTRATIPAQEDGYNCGPFLLAFAKSIFYNLPAFDFQSSDMDQFRMICADELTTQKLTKKIRETDEDEIEVEVEEDTDDGQQHLPETEDEVEEETDDDEQHLTQTEEEVEEDRQEQSDGQHEVEEIDEDREENSHGQEEVVEISDSEQNVQQVGQNSDEDEEAVHDTQHQVEEIIEDTQEQSNGQEPVDYNGKFKFQIFKTIRPTDQQKEENNIEQEVEEILDCLENGETVANTEDGHDAVENLEQTSNSNDIDNISTPINSPIPDFNPDVIYDFGQSSSNQMNISNGLSTTVNEESLNTNREPSTSKKRKFDETFKSEPLLSLYRSCKKFQLENSNNANSMESEILDEEPEILEHVEQEMVVDIVEQPQPQILYDVQQEIPQHEPVQPNVNLEQEMLVDIVQQPQILEHVQQEMVVDIVEQPQPQILYDVQQEIAQHEPELQQEIPIVDNNEADIKIHPHQQLTVFMTKEHYFDLPKPQKIDISKKMQAKVRYYSKDLYRRQKFTANTESILEYLELVEEKNLAVTFNFECSFDKPVQNEQHHRELFQDMISNDNIRRTAFPSKNYSFVDITISQFKTFLTIFN